MSTTLQEIDEAVAEAELIRSRHEGVHAVHGLVTALRICRELYREGDWCPRTAQVYHEAVRRMRSLDRTGFLPHAEPRNAVESGRACSPAPRVSELMGRSLLAVF